MLIHYTLIFIRFLVMSDGDISCIGFIISFVPYIADLKNTNVNCLMSILTFLGIFVIFVFVCMFICTSVSYTVVYEFHFLRVALLVAISKSL